jgi:hypothetical protein
MRVNLSEKESWLYGGGSITLGNSTGMTDSGRRRSSAIIGGQEPWAKPEGRPTIGPDR